MVHIRIQVTEETHVKLLEEQFRRKANKLPRTTLAEVASDMLHQYLVIEKAPPK